MGEGQTSTMLGGNGKCLILDRYPTNLPACSDQVVCSDQKVNEVGRIQITPFMHMVNIPVRIASQPVQVDGGITILDVIHLLPQHQPDPVNNPAIRVCLVGLSDEQVNQRLDGGPPPFETLGQRRLYHHHVDL